MAAVYEDMIAIDSEKNKKRLTTRGTIRKNNSECYNNETLRRPTYLLKLVSSHRQDR